MQAEITKSPNHQSPITQSPITSVCFITYNHEAYIQQALDSILAQQTAFDFEIVIGEDVSTDRTRAICEQYAAQFPNVIRLLDSPHNLGPTANVIRTLKACRGKYVALLEGDDYWIDAQKLQKQVDALEKDDKITLCFTGRRNYLENENTFVEVNEDKGNNRFYIQDFALNTYFHTSTFMFRQPKTTAWLGKLASSQIGDRPLYIALLAETGGYALKLKDVCSVFRLNLNSTFSPTQPLERTAMVAKMYVRLKDIYPELSKYFNIHLNVADYFFLRDAHRKHDKAQVKALARQIIRRPTILSGYFVKAKAALHLFI